MSQYHCNGYFLIYQNRSRRRCHDNKSNFGSIHPKYNSSFSTSDDQKSLTKYLFHTMLQQNSKLLIKMVTQYIILSKQIRVAVGKNFILYGRNPFNSAKRIWRQPFSRDPFSLRTPLNHFFEILKNLSTCNI